VESVLPIGTTQVIVRLQGDNLFNERYTVIRNFPMPGRSLRVSLRAVLR
jgi:outer membrane receptor protein involved in Fe transport